MSFKIHLIIIGFIIVCVVLAWDVISQMPKKAPDAAAHKAQYALAITHASWGLNCRGENANTDNSQDIFAKKPEVDDKLHEDNVLGPVSLLCNGNTQCDIIANESVLGPDPAPGCNKNLEVEYRCFSYDRPWNVKSISGELSLHCEQPQ